MLDVQHSQLLWTTTLPGTPTQTHVSRQLAKRLNRILTLTSSQLAADRHVVLEAAAQNHRAWEQEDVRHWLELNHGSNRVRTKYVRPCNLGVVGLDGRRASKLIRLETTIDLNPALGDCSRGKPTREHADDTRRNRDSASAQAVRRSTSEALATLLTNALTTSRTMATTASSTTSAGRRARPEFKYNRNEHSSVSVPTATITTSTTDHHQHLSKADDHHHHNKADERQYRDKDSNVASFPTEAAMRAKAKHKMLQAIGPDHAKPIRRKQVIEQHFDDCGEDTGSLDIAFWNVTAKYPQDEHDPADDLRQHYTVNIMLTQGLYGSGLRADTDPTIPNGRAYVVFTEFLGDWYAPVYVATRSGNRRDYADVIELRRRGAYAPGHHPTISCHQDQDGLRHRGGHRHERQQPDQRLLALYGPLRRLHSGHQHALYRPCRLAIPQPRHQPRSMAGITTHITTTRQAHRAGGYIPTPSGIPLHLRAPEGHQDVPPQ